MMRRAHLLMVWSAAVLLAATTAWAEVWDASADFSITANPNGAWSYCGKPTIEGTSAFLLTHVWDGWIWFPGNVGHGAPAVGSGPVMWAKNNSNGYPAVRWTCPEDGSYDIQGSFSGADGRGVDNLVYVVIDGVIQFNGHVASNEDVAPFFIDDVYLEEGEVVDFTLKWNGGVYSEYGWTLVSAVIPEPTGCFVVGSVLLASVARQRRRDSAQQGRP
jgi:hypothetical protein